MSSTIDTRKEMAATAVGVEADSVASIQLDIARMKELGVLVDIDLHGFSMFTRRATWAELGVPNEDLRRKRLKRGSKDMLPKEQISRLRSLETRFRQCLECHSFVLEGFRPWRWIPYTAYESWKDEWTMLQADLEELKATILETYLETVDQIIADFGQIADEAWDAVSARRPANAQAFAIVTREGASDDRLAFRAYVVDRALQELPEPEDIQVGLYVSYRNAIVATSADLEAEYLRQTEAAIEREAAWASARHQREMHQLEIHIARREADLELRERERRLQAMRQAELQHAREQLTETMSPFVEVVQQFRAQIYNDVQEISNSIASNGYIHGKVATRARGLLDVYRLLGAATNDTELETTLLHLRDRLAESADSETKYDMGSVSSALANIATLTHDAAVEVAKRAGAHTRAGAIEF